MRKEEEKNPHLSFNTRARLRPHPIAPVLVVKYNGAAIEGLLESTGLGGFFADFYTKEPKHIHRVRLRLRWTLFNLETVGIYTQIPRKRRRFKRG